MKTVLVVPNEWIDILKSQEKRLNFIQPFSLCAHSFSINEGVTKKIAKQYDASIISENEIALWVLPQQMAIAKMVKYYPRVCGNDSKGGTINAVFFADSVEDLFVFLETNAKTVNKRHKTYVSCQYEFPYKGMLEKWSKAGAKAIHPGEYFKEDFLRKLPALSGSWVYFGHALGDRLRGYGHLLTKELIANKPCTQLSATLWFTCSTLDIKVKDNIALSWYLSGATNCLLASPEAVKTEANQKLGNAYLALLKKKKRQSVAETLLNLSRRSSIHKETLSQYCLLGNPWAIVNL